jgi:GNAT superfamily N-acetyltransferase
MTAVRVATEADLDTVVGTVAQAFVGDPAWDYMCGPGNDEAAAAFATLLFLGRVPRGTVWIADDGAAVSMWDRVDGSPSAGMEQLWAEFARTAGQQVVGRVEAYDAAIKALKPSAPFWYLGVLATHPDHQGRGLATAVLQPGLARADAEGWDAWLETSKPANKGFYAGRGFTDVRPVEIPDGPPTWWIRRPAAAG